jgi:hypothetical protein
MIPVVSPTALVRVFKKSSGTLLFVVALSLCVFAQSISSSDPTRYLDDVKALTTPAMEGRGDGTKGLTHARDLLVKRYKELGLKPAGTNGYLQAFSVITGAKLKSDNRLVVENGSEKKELKLSQDFVPFSFSSSGTVSAPVVFAGYGASADEFGYDDYSGIDVKDKIVVVLRYEPSSFAEKSGNTGLTARAVDHESDQRTQSRRQGDRAGERKARRRRRGPADPLWQRERPGELRHRARASEE